MAVHYKCYAKKFTYYSLISFNKSNFSLTINLEYVNIYLGNNFSSCRVTNIIKIRSERPKRIGGPQNLNHKNTLFYSGLHSYVQIEGYILWNNN
jgi:hypothetical protein